MAAINTVDAQDYDGSVLVIDLLSGNNTNLILNDFDATIATTVSDNNGVLDVGEQVTLGDGRIVTVLGSGTITPGVNILGLTVPLGTPSPTILTQDEAGQLIFLYPEGPPNLLDAVAAVANLSPVGFGLPVVCFTLGTPILCEQGWVQVEDIRPGMRVQTLDNGLTEVAWHNGQHLSKSKLARNEMRPILIEAGSMGDNLPYQDLRLSPQHRVLINTKVARNVVGTPEVLIPAKQLLGMPGVSIDYSASSVTYYHFMAERHEVIISAGALTESFFAGPQALKSIPPDARKELLTIFPDLESNQISEDTTGDTSAVAPARSFVRGRDARKIVERCIKNDRYLMERERLAG